MGIGAGDLDVRCVVRRLKEGVQPNTAGHVDETDEANWRDMGKRWVKLVPRGSREFFRGQQVAEDITHQIYMLRDSHSQRFTTKDKLVSGSRQFNLAGPGVDVDERHETLSFPAVEIK